MKTITICILTTILLVGSTTLVPAQPDPVSPSPTDEIQREIQRTTETIATIKTDLAAQRAMLRSPAIQQMRKNAEKQTMNALWYGDTSNIMTTSFLYQEDFRVALGISEEQFQKIEEAHRKAFDDDNPGTKPIRNEMTKLIMENGNLFAENASEESQNRFFELQAQLGMKTNELMMEGLATAIYENLTPDQIKKIDEALIPVMSEMPIISTSVFRILDLSDAQKKQLDEIKKEILPEYEEYVNNAVDASMKLTIMAQEEIERWGNVITDSDKRTKLSQNLENLHKSNPELQRAMNEVRESGKRLSETLKVKMFDVLTDEQWNRMIDLIDNPPEYVKKAIAQIRKEMGHASNAAQTGEVWTPGPNSWQPGDPIPEEYRQKRNEKRNFPRPKPEN